MTKLNPCRFCGETDKLAIDRDCWETEWAIDAAGEVIRDETGQPTGSDDERFPDHHHLTQVNCEVCEVMAPLRVWNGTPDFLARMRANIAAADAEFDDAGVWRGRGVAA